MASAKILDTISAIEGLTYVVPQELRDDASLRRRLYDAMQKLVLEVETPEETSQRLLYTPCEMMGAKIGVDLNIFELLTTSSKPQSTDDLSATTGAEPVLLSRLLKFMASFGLIKELQFNLWGPSNTTRNLASRGGSAGVNHKHDSVMPAWHALPSWLQRHEYKSPSANTDTPFAQGHNAPPDQSFFAWLKEHPYNATEFNLFMGVHRSGAKTWLDLPEALQLLESGKAHTNGASSFASERVVFVDVGGGLGQQCKALKAKFPNLGGRVILQDLPEVISKANVEPNIEAMAVDFFKPQLVHGAGVYYIRSVLRDWPDAQCVTILGHIRNAMASNSLVLIDEIVLSDQGATKIETQLDMTMLAMLNGQARSGDHWKRLLLESGLGLQDILYYQTGGREAVLVAKRI